MMRYYIIIMFVNRLWSKGIKVYGCIVVIIYWKLKKLIEFYFERIWDIFFFIF